jgi:hypothetical protein
MMSHFSYGGRKFSIFDPSSLQRLDVERILHETTYSFCLVGHSHLHSQKH